MKGSLRSQRLTAPLTVGTSPLSTNECQEFPWAQAGISEPSASQTLFSLVTGCSAPLPPVCPSQMKPAESDPCNAPAPPAAPMLCRTPAGSTIVFWGRRAQGTTDTRTVLRVAGWRGAVSLPGGGKLTQTPCYRTSDPALERGGGGELRIHHSEPRDGEG